MARPRLYDPELILDAAERLVAGSGPDGVTIRGLAAAAGVSNGAIYHAFGSLPALLGRVWLRAAGDFLDLQETAVREAAKSAEPPAGAAVDAVVAAADAPAAFALRRPAAARMLMSVDRERLLGPELPDELAADLLALDRRLLDLLKRLARGLWGRADAAAVEVVTLCVVDLPTAAFRRALTAPVADEAAVAATPIGADTRRRLEAAVRAVLAIPPPGRPGRRPSTSTTKE
ncbi:helix-turn-helix domain-containing protein [Actinomadura keratinilytica]|jgi:AcrR family transcriptional regulator|uniref:TetR/AcrR family transcriptional regulator n=1 Tax=Actinomadura keratinilytica TaxID=547461 RepID=A0ABP7ZIQ3_9ACTN